jgi:lipopolysaccharide transport system ATP-binding protein
VTGLSKQYTVGTADGSYRTLREALTDVVKAPLKKWRNKETAANDSTIWALKDVDFEVQPGETLGIIGRNGAGKSTLLKVLTRITEPTTGRVQLNGRVASLLEVGTGFHPELTGRENVYLNGAILGMTHREMDRKFDRIVAFSSVEKFIDTPVKRYSSGMQLRLAFAVAAHLEPEILVIDEVLAVGDASFQRSCIERMKELASSGCTLLFVSHNMEMIPTLCRSALWMRGGQIAGMGSAHTITDDYLASLSGESSDEMLTNKPRSGDGRARFRRLQLLGEDGRPLAAVKYDEDLRCVMEIDSKGDYSNVSLAIVIKTVTGTRLVTSSTNEFGEDISLQAGRRQVECRFKRLRIRPGRQVAIEVWMHDGELLDCIDTARIMDVTASPSSDISLRSDQGAYVCDYTWTP